MSEFHVRSDAVDVEQIMRQIRARIREKRGADYTEAELQQLASVKLEQFLDPRGVRSDLVDAFRRHRIVSPEPPTYEFEETTLYESHRPALRTIRRLLHPILKLFMNPGKLVQALHVQRQINAEFHRRFRQREELDPLYYELVHNLVLEITRLGIDVHNLKMRVESLSSRIDFDERRARALEGTVQYRPSAPSPAAASAAPRTPEPERRPPPPTGPDTTSGARPAAPGGAGGEGPQGERRRRRRRRRRPGRNAAFAGHTSPGSAAPPTHDGLASDHEGAVEADGEVGPEDGDSGASDQ